MMKRTPKEILEFLCQDMPEYWHADDKGKPIVNIYRLAKDLGKWAEKGNRKGAPKQSTLDRAYSGESKFFKDPALEALSDYFRVPTAIIRGDVDMDSLEAWGMDINISELRLLRAVRDLSSDQRVAIYKLLRSMLPDHAGLIPPIQPPEMPYTAPDKPPRRTQ